MMYQKALATRSFRKGFFAPQGTNTDLTKKGLRLYFHGCSHFPIRTNTDLTKKGLRLTTYRTPSYTYGTNTDLTKKGLRRSSSYNIRRSRGRIQT